MTPPGEFTLCRGTGLVTFNGACPLHGGDACLMQYVPKDTTARLEAEVAKLRGALEWLALEGYRMGPAGVQKFAALSLESTSEARRGAGGAEKGEGT